MKKLLLVATIGVAGLVSAMGGEKVKDESKSKSSQKKESSVDKNKKEQKRFKCEAVDTSCGEPVWACGETNEDGELDWEVLDDMRQLGEEAFCN